MLALEAAVAKSSAAGGGPASLDSATSAGDSSNFTTTLLKPLLDPSLDFSLTQDNLSFDYYDQQTYEDESAPALTFTSIQTADISILDTSLESDGAVAAATVSAAEVAKENVAWIYLKEAGDGEGGGTTSHDQSGISPARSIAQYYHAHYSSPPPATLKRRSNNRHTALHIAASQGNSCMVKLLLDRGADAGLLNKDGQTPLHLAVMAVAEAAKRCGSASDSDVGGGSGEAKEAERTLQLLLRARGSGADLYALDSSGHSVLFTAVAAGSEAAVQMILDAIGSESLADSSSGSSSGSKAVGSDVGPAGIRAVLNKPDAQGTLPLHLAVESGLASMVLLLLSNGANING